MDPALTAAAIGVGGTVIVGLAGFWANVRNTNKTAALALRAVELTEQGQVTDRYSKAIEQLGSGNLSVCIGGIYALERIARDSPRDHPTIMEVLAAFIREESRELWLPAEPGAEPPEREMGPKVQAAATVIGRRNARHDSEPVNLNAAVLTGADLTRADLTRADLTGADLTGANLTRANLTDADLIGANLTRASLRDANLTNAKLIDAKLTDAKLAGANFTGAILGITGLEIAGLGTADLTNADLRYANLTRAKLIRANLTNANLTSADLTDADLIGANLTGANLSSSLWSYNAAVPAGWRRDAGSARLTRANIGSGGAATDPAPTA
jgi:uncharacterized protein YjbI with pentapeptide repeats